MSENRYGLSREIPAGVKREVRQRCGFGCIFDGRLICDYDHFDPEFRDCREHLAAGITLLCKECHGEKTAGMISDEQIRAANSDPAARRAGFVHRFQKMGNGPVEVTVGSLVAINTPTVLHVLGTDLLFIGEPSVAGGPLEVSARFYDRTGRPTLRIIRNEIRASVANWDVDQTGNRLTIRNGLGDFALVLAFTPPNEVAIERLAMRYRQIFAIDHVPGSPTRIQYGGHLAEVQSMRISDARCAIVAGLGGIAYGAGGGAVSFTGAIRSS